MNNGFGINFLRYVCEEDHLSWSQVFARLPFDEVEIKQKGALFGVVRSFTMKDWADIEMEMTNWVEEYFNAVEVGGDLAKFFVEFRKKYGEVDCLWLWVSIEGGVKRMRAIGSGEVFLVVERNGVNIELSENIKGERVIAGELKDEDSVRMWVGGLDTDFETWEKAEQNKSYAGLKITSKKTSGVVAEEVEVVLEETPVDHGVKIFDKEGLAGDNFIGPLSTSLKIRNWWNKRKRGVILVAPKAAKQRKWSVMVGVLFLVLLFISLALGSTRKKEKERDLRWSNFSQPIEKSLTEALGLVKINPIGSRKLVEDARADFELKKLSFGDKEFVEKVLVLDKKIAEAWVSVSGEKKGEVLDLVNLELIRAGVSASRISLVGEDKFVVLSVDSGLVMSVVTATKEIKVVAGKGAGLGWVDAVSDGKRFYIMSKTGVSLAENESNPLVFDTAITDPVALAKFGSSLYVLERGNKEVFKFLVNETGFGERTRWLKEGQSISGVPLDMDIDVDVWVLSEGAQVERFRRGAKEPFSLGNVPKDFLPERISVEKTGNRIALLSTKLGVVVFCNKDSGKCDQIVKSDKIREAKDIEFNGENQLLLLFSGTVGVLN